MGKMTVTGRLPNDLANSVSDAIHAAQQAGMECDEAVCVAIGVAADYARIEYGDGYLLALCDVLMSRSGQPHPQNIASSPAGQP